MKCFDKSTPIVTQLSSNLFVAVHMGENELYVDCDNHPTLNITGDIGYGALRIFTSCACNLRQGRATVGRSQGPACLGHESIVVDVLLPGAE